MIQRTWLFSPGDDPRKLDRACSLRVDALIVDWEDGVDGRRKAEARAATAAIFADAAMPAGPGRGAPRSDTGDRGGDRAAFPGPRRRGIRINAARTDLHAADLDAVATLRPDFVMLPKVEEPADLERARLLALPVIALVESARGLQAIAELASAGAPLERFAFGALDLCVDLGSEWSSDNPLLEVARARLVLASRAAGLSRPVDSVFPDLADPDGLHREAARARAAGFAGKMLVHPAQIDPVAAAFAPGEERVERARRILTAFRSAREQGVAVATVDGTFVDAPAVAWARGILEEAGEPAGG